MLKANSGVMAALQKIITSQGKGAGNTDKFDVPTVDYDCFRRWGFPVAEHSSFNAAMIVG